jgi:hypothetical protein
MKIKKDTKNSQQGKGIKILMAYNNGKEKHKGTYN